MTLILFVHFLIAGGAAYLSSEGLTAGGSILGRFWLGVAFLQSGSSDDRTHAAQGYAHPEQPSSQRTVLVWVVLPAFIAAVAWAFHRG